MKSEFSIIIFNIKNKPDKGKSFALLIFGILAFAGIYSPINWINSQRDFHYSLYFDWELSIPLVSSFILVYFSAYLLPLVSLYKMSFEEHKVLIKALILSGIIGGVIFLLIPTRLGFERNLSEVEHFKFMFKLLWYLDFPHNLLPSLHVVMSHLLVVPAMRNVQSRLWKGFGYFWVGLVCASIVLVHQHHIADIITGLLLSIGVYKLYCLPRLQSLTFKSQKEKNSDDFYKKAS